MPLPEISASLFSWLLLGPVIAIGFFATGHLCFQRLPSPLPWVSAFIGSALLLFCAVLLFDLLAVPITLITLITLLGGACLVGWRTRNRALVAPARLTWDRWRPTRHDWWWLLPCIFAIGSVLLRGIFQPLAGFDNFFRWDYLAHLMHFQQSLAHYPPVTAGDFRFYSWCDGIPPLVPIVNLWIYLGTGSTSGTLIVGRLFVELALTYGLVWHLARSLWGELGARVAVLALSGCTIFLWSIGMEQETGLSGVCLLAVAAFGIAYQRSPAIGTAVWTTLAAALAALTRDYNLIYIPVAGLILLLARAPRRHLLPALTVALLAVAPWYARNWLITGNPLFPHDLGGLFPTNFIHHELMQSIRNYWSLDSSHARYATLWSGLAVGLGPLLLLSLPGWRFGRTDVMIIALAGLTNAALWLASMASTAGGWIYALRVLGTGLPLLAVMTGWWGQHLRGKLPWLFAALLLPFCADAARRSWVFTWSPFTAPWPYDWQGWSDVHHYIKVSRGSPVWSVLANAAQDEKIIVDSSNYFVLGGRAGGTMVSLFSPEAETLTGSNPAHGLDEIVGLLRAQGVRYVILTDDNWLNREFLLGRPRLRQLFQAPSTYEAEGMKIYDLAKLHAQPVPDTQ
jgi:hypothetical protein